MPQLTEEREDMNKGQETELYFEQQEAEVLDESGLPELLNSSMGSYQAASVDPYLPNKYKNAKTDSPTKKKAKGSQKLRPSNFQIESKDKSVDITDIKSNNQNQKEQELEISTEKK